jgi:hypothetical protein
VVSIGTGGMNYVVERMPGKRRRHAVAARACVGKNVHTFVGILESHADWVEFREWLGFVEQLRLMQLLFCADAQQGEC